MTTERTISIAFVKKRTINSIAVLLKRSASLAVKNDIMMAEIHRIEAAAIQNFVQNLLGIDVGLSGKNDDKGE